MKSLFLSLVYIVAAYSISALGQDMEDARQEASRALADQLQAELGSRLMSTLATEGPVEAIDVCQLEAPGIATRVSSGASAQVGRTALKVRNPANLADEEAREVLNLFQKQLDDGEPGPQEYFAESEDGSARYMRSISTQAMCLVCHGSNLEEDVKAAIAERYPFDEATGFAAGDLRGAFIIEWPAPAVP